jgi:hypothetical protein
LVMQRVVMAAVIVIGVIVMLLAFPSGQEDLRHRPDGSAPLVETRP